MREKEKQDRENARDLAKTTNDVEKIWNAVTDARSGRDIHQAALLNPKTPPRVLEWLHEHGNDLDALIAIHPNATDAMLKKMLGNYVIMMRETENVKYPSWSAFVALIVLLNRKAPFDDDVLSILNIATCPGAPSAWTVLYAKKENS